MKLQVLNTAWIWAVPWMMLDTRQGGLRSVVPRRRWESKSTPQALSQRRQAECDIAASQARVRAEFKSEGFWCHIISPKESHFGEWTLFLGSSEILAGLHHTSLYKSRWVIESAVPNPLLVQGAVRVRRRACSRAILHPAVLQPAQEPFHRSDLKAPFSSWHFWGSASQVSTLTFFFGNSHGI